MNSSVGWAALRREDKRDRSLLRLGAYSLFPAYYHNVGADFHESGFVLDCAYQSKDLGSLALIGPTCLEFISQPAGTLYCYRFLDREANFPDLCFKLDRAMEKSGCKIVFNVPWVAMLSIGQVPFKDLHEVRIAN